MGKRKKRKRDKDSYRKLCVGVLKGKSHKLSRMITEREIPLDKDIIYNSIMSIVADAYCKGYEQNTHERSLFKGKKEALLKKAWDDFETELSDSINQNK